MPIAADISGTSRVGVAVLDELVDALKAGEHRLQGAAQKVGLGDVGVTLPVWDGDFMCGRAFATRALCRLLGLLDAHALDTPQKLLDIVHPDDRDTLSEIIAAAQTQKGVCSPFHTAMRLRAADGFWRYLICHGYMVTHAQGMHQRMLLIAEDHTQAQLHRQELQYARDFGEKVVRSTVNGILGFDATLNIIEFNPALEQMFGVRRADAVGRNVFDVLPFLRETHEDCFYYDTLAGKKQASFDRPYWRIDSGDTGFFRANYIPLREGGREVTGGLVVVAETTFDRLNQHLQHTLLEAGTRLAQCTEPDAVISTLLQLTVPGLCDWSVVYLADTEQFVVRHRDPAQTHALEQMLCDKTPALHAFLCEAPALADSQVVATETVLEVPNSLLRMIARHEGIGETLRRAGMVSYFRVALTSQGRTLGTMTFVTRDDTLSERHRAVSELVALRGALALSNAYLIRRSRGAEETLMRIDSEVLAPLRAGTRAHATAQMHHGPDEVGYMVDKLQQLLYSTRGQGACGKPRSGR